MSVIALGINHKTAPVNVRERVAFAPENLSHVLRDLKHQVELPEVAILSTCNRMELYSSQIDHRYGHVIDWLSKYHDVSSKDIETCLYVHSDEDAVKHVMRVASGLDSLVLGEPQILGQMKQAFNTATEAGTIGSCLGRLFQQTFSVAKQVRTDTQIGSSAVSVAYAAVSLSRHIFDDFSKVTALFIGAGETIELAARHLYNQGARNIIVANRTLSRAANVARLFDGSAIELAEIPSVLDQADIVIASTASSLPILGKGMVESALKRRKRKPMFMVDLAVPRDIESEVSKLEDVYLYTVDDLQEVIQENLKARTEAADEAEDIIGYHSNQFMGWLQSQGMVDVIRNFREKYQQLRDSELEKAMAQLAQGGDFEQVITQFSRRLTNKFLHEPTLELRKVGANGDQHQLDFFKNMFGLDNN